MIGLTVPGEGLISSTPPVGHAAKSSHLLPETAMTATTGSCAHSRLSHRIQVALDTLAFQRPKLVTPQGLPQ